MVGVNGDGELEFILGSNLPTLPLHGGKADAVIQNATKKLDCHALFAMTVLEDLT